MRRTLVWDIPVRLFHWMLAVGFVAVYALAETRGDDDPGFVLHMGLGLVVGVMAVLRIVWGLFGTEHARFTGLALSPAALARYVRGIFRKPEPAFLGHNPASSYAALAMLAFALGLAISGLLLARGNRGAHELHEICATGFLLVSILHVLGVIWHGARYRDGIAFGIIDGKKVGGPDSASVARHGVVGLMFAALIAGCCGLLLYGYDAKIGRIDIPGTGWSLGGGRHDDDDDDDDHDHDRRERHERRNEGDDD